MKNLLASGTVALALLAVGCDSNHTSPLSATAPSTASATAGSPYSQTLSETGGKAPYTWAVVSGSSLPTGLSLDATTGVISGTPTKGGSYTTQIQVTDSSSPAKVAIISFSLTVAYAPISVTTASLPAGVVGTAYLQTLAATGGNGVYTWLVVDGSLPAGLTLSSSTGVISGTPTTGGSSTVKIQVADGSSPANTATASYSFAIANQPISITTTSLPGGTVAAAYAQTLTAIGGNGDYTWSVIGGTLPSGLTLNAASGILSGTPTTAASSSFTVQVADTTGATATQSLSVSVQAAPITGDALLQGQYLFKLDSFIDGQVYAGHEVFVGSLTLDGAGNVTAGLVDFGDDDGNNMMQMPATGSYSIGSDGRGTLTLQLPPGTVQFQIAVAGAQSNAVAVQVSLVETDARYSFERYAQCYGSGFLQKQDTSAFSTTSLVGSSVFGWSGDTYLGSTDPSLAQQGGLSLAGQLVIDSSLNLTAASSADIATNLAADTSISLSGTVAGDATPGASGATNFAAFGRATVTLPSTSYPNGVLPHITSLYIIDANTYYAMGVPGSDHSPIYSGYVRKQSGTFDGTTLTGSLVAYGTSQHDHASTNYASYAGTQTLYGSSEAFLGRFVGDGAGNLHLVLDRNEAGAVGTNLASDLTYSVSSTGRVTTSGGFVMWLSGPNQGFATTLPSNGTSYAELLTLEPQTAQNYSAANLTGSYISGTLSADAFDSTNYSGLVALDGSGNLTNGTIDFFGDGGAQAFGTGAPSISGTYQVDAYGRGTLLGNLLLSGSAAGTESLVFETVSPSRAVAISNTAAGTAQTVVVLQK